MNQIPNPISLFSYIISYIFILYVLQRVVNVGGPPTQSEDGHWKRDVNYVHSVSLAWAPYNYNIIILQSPW